MPMYDYSCVCGNKFEVFARMLRVTKYQICQLCGRLAKKKITAPNVRTDTSFFATGKYDMNVCENRDDLIEGRKDWKRRLKKKKLRVLDWSEVKNPKQLKEKPKLVFAGE